MHDDETTVLNYVIHCHKPAMAGLGYVIHSHQVKMAVWS